MHFSEVHGVASDRALSLTSKLESRFLHVIFCPSLRPNTSHTAAGVSATQRAIFTPTKYIPHPSAGTLGSETRDQLTLIDLAKAGRLSKMGWIKVAEAQVEFWFITWQR